MGIRKLILSYFRNHTDFELALLNDFILIHGHNGIGKTNILEAISFLAPGKGLRGAKLEDIGSTGTEHDWSVYAEIDSKVGVTSIGTGFTKQNERGNKRLLKINGDPAKTNAEVLNYIRILWLTPQMDGLFLDTPGARRKFLDRLTYNFFSDHARMINKYEYFLRERSKILNEHNIDIIWLEAVEKELIVLSSAIAKSRLQSIELLQKCINKSLTNFLKPIIKIEGAIEDIVRHNPEDIEAIREEFLKARKLDIITKRNSVGTHKSDLIVTHSQKMIPAATSSTGEQKAMLISIILAQASAIRKDGGTPCIILLDEVLAHLDDERKEELIKEIQLLQVQVWITAVNDEVVQITDKLGIKIDNIPLTN